MDEKVVLVTGASSGIGAAIALHLASIGYKKLALVGRRKERLEEVAEECKRKGAKDVLVLIKDLEVTSNARETVDLTVEKFQRLDVVIYNAGVLENMWSFLDKTKEVYDKTVQINLKSAYFLVQQAIPHLERTKGNILLVSSIIDRLYFPGPSVYALSKTSLTLLAKCLALELGPSGVRANVLSPGVVKTEIFRSLDEDFLDGPNVARDYSLIGRIGEADEMAKTAAFLISDDNSFMTGASLVSDGGLCVMSKGPIPKLDKLPPPPSKVDLPRDKGSQVVLVVGATSGIGAATAKHLAKTGYKHLALVGRRKEQLEAVAKECETLGATNVLVLIKDLEQDGTEEEVVQETIDHFKRLDVVIANAGIFGGLLPIRDQTEANFDKIMQVNVRSNFFLCQKAAPHLERTKGNIVIVSSVADTLVGQGTSVYAMSKAAASKLGQVLAVELSSRGVRANVLCPGLVQTDIFRNLGMDVFNNPDLEKQVSAIGRIGASEEMAATLAFMISEENAFMTGSAIVSDGGMMIMTPGPTPTYN